MRIGFRVSGLGFRVRSLLAGFPDISVPLFGVLTRNLRFGDLYLGSHVFPKPPDRGLENPNRVWGVTSSISIQGP